MDTLTTLLVPALLTGVCAWAVFVRKVDAYAAMLNGAKNGLRTAADILPGLVVLLTGIHMLRASGALSLLGTLSAPALRLLGIPPETAALVFLRPFSGSGALAVGSEIMGAYGPDSYIGRCAAVMLGSTETTFYVLTVYFARAQSKPYRRAVPAALAADLTGFTLAALTVRLLFPR